MQSMVFIPRVTNYKIAKTYNHTSATTLITLGGILLRGRLRILLLTLALLYLRLLCGLPCRSSCCTTSSLLCSVLMWVIIHMSDRICRVVHLIYCLCPLGLLLITLLIGILLRTRLYNGRLGSST